jgi:hypothetical protein
MTPGDLYRTCRVSAYRIETLQHYVVPDDEERQRAFHRLRGYTHSTDPGLIRQCQRQYLLALDSSVPLGEFR